MSQHRTCPNCGAFGVIEGALERAIAALREPPADAAGLVAELRRATRADYKRVDDLLRRAADALRAAEQERDAKIPEAAVVAMQERAAVERQKLIEERDAALCQPPMTDEVLNGLCHELWAISQGKPIEDCVQAMMAEITDSLRQPPADVAGPTEARRIDNLRRIAADDSVNNFARAICGEAADALAALTGEGK